MVIGIFGLISAGKDTVAEYLMGKGFSHISLSQVLRDEAKKAGVPSDRESLRTFSTKLKAQEGGDVLVKRAIERIHGDTLVTSIRHPREVEILRTVPDFTLISVDAPIEARYQRAKLRLRDGDALGTLEEFAEAENKERTGTGGQIMDEVEKLVDFRVDNSGSFEDLYRNIDEVVAKISGKQ